MFGIGSTELLVIFVVALIVLGPKSIPQIAKTLGKAMGEFKRVSTDFQRTMNAEVEMEEHEKRKKQAEEELFGDKDTDKAHAAAAGTAAPPSQPESPVAPAASAAPVAPAAAPTAPAESDYIDTFATDSPLAKAVAKAEAEAAAAAATAAAPLSPKPHGPQEDKA